MVYDAETTARNAEADQANDPGYCLQQCRLWAGIPAKYPDAATAWKHTDTRHPGALDPPRGAAAYWTGGTHGYGHIAISLGGGRIRSTDAGGPGRVATVPISWIATNWGLPYAGWSWEINDKTIRHKEADDMLTKEDLDAIDQRIRNALNDMRPSYVSAFLAGEVDSREPEPTTVKKALRLGADLARDYE